MNPRRPRIVLGTAVVLLTALLALFTAGLLDDRADQRAAADARFADRASVTAGLLQSFAGAGVAEDVAVSERSLAGAPVNLRVLRERAAADDADYALVLDGAGEVLAATNAVTPAVRQRLLGRPDYLRPVLSGSQDWGVSGFVGAGALEYATAFETPDGDRRVLVEAFQARLIAPFLALTFARMPEAEHQRTFVVDAADRVVAASVSTAPVGAEVDPAAGGRALAAAPIDGTQWRVVLAQHPDVLYAGTGTPLQWAVLAALALVGIAVIVLIVRAAHRDAALRTAYADLERANAELLRSNGDLEQFASIASHDLQEPLRKVQAFGDLLARRFAGELPEEGQDYLRRMQGASERMSVLIDDLLRLSRVTTHAKTPERVDLTALAREVVEDLDARHSVLVDELPVVDGDPVQLRQLLQNLIANGLKFRREGVAPLVRLRRRQGSGPGRVAFAVSDNGIGFEADQAERIFAVFERLHSRDVYPGTGIGLALCRRIVERHGGTITATAQPGHGAVFTVDLPAPTLPAAPVPPQHDREPTLV